MKGRKDCMEKFHQLQNSLGNTVFNTRQFSGMSHFAHIHKSYELLFVERGSLRCVIDGTEVWVYAGEFVMIFPFQIHSFEVPPAGNVYVVVFSEDFVRYFFNATNRLTTKTQKFTCTDEVTRYFRNCMIIDFPEFSGKPNMIETLTIKSCLYGVCSDLLRQAEFSATDRSETKNTVTKIFEYISRHFSEDISLRSIAGELGYSYPYISKCFNEYTQTNFKTLLNQYRFEYAKELLRETRKPMSEVALESGFQSIRNFNLVFFHFAGVSPREFRNSQ